MTFQAVDPLRWPSMANDMQIEHTTSGSKEEELKCRFACPNVNQSWSRINESQIKQIT